MASPQHNYSTLLSTATQYIRSANMSRDKGHMNVVQAIEGPIFLLSGWMMENYAPAFLDANFSTVH
ncbi:unnamed protein product, partial [Urochloa humidicola]